MLLNQEISAPEDAGWAGKWRWSTADKPDLHPDRPSLPYSRLDNNSSRLRRRRKRIAHTNVAAHFLESICQ